MSDEQKIIMCVCMYVMCVCMYVLRGSMSDEQKIIMFVCMYVMCVCMYVLRGSMSDEQKIRMVRDTLLSKNFQNASSPFSEKSRARRGQDKNVVSGS